MIVDLLESNVPVGTKVTISGWVRTRRDSKAGCSFIALHDGSCFKTLQIVVSNALANYNDEILRLTAGCAITVCGELVSSPAKGQAVELKAEQVKVIGWVDDPDTYPIAAKYHTLEYLRDYAHLRARTNIIGAVTRVSHSMAFAIHEFLNKHRFQWIRTPIITASDCEGAGQMFRVSTLDLANLPRDPEGKINFAEDFFGKETFLTVSGQLNAEAYCLALSRVYTFGPTFRAENSNTSRHLAEFWMVEPEIAFADLKADALLAEDLLKYVAQVLLRDRADDMAFFAERVDKDCITRLQQMINSKFTHMEYSEAIKILQQSGKKFDFPVTWGNDLQSEHERYLAEEQVKGPVVLMNYPKEIKSFYMRLNDDEKTVAAMDVLVPGIGEIIGGSQREERFSVLSQRMSELKLDKEAYRWYSDLRRYGTVPHAGFGLGFERFVSYVTGIANVRDVIPFPRTPKNCNE